MTTFLTVIALAMTIFVSPEIQVLLGNGMGMVGWLFPFSLVLVAALHLLTFRAYADMYGGTSAVNSEYAFLQPFFGRWLPLTTSLASRLVFMVCAAPISLVTAGYVFNEVFVYWFANFAFAFLLLGLIFIVHLAGSRWARKLQVVFVALVLAVISILIVAGLSSFSGPPPGRDIDFQGRGLLLPFLMIIGVEFVFLTGCDQQDEVPRVSQFAYVFLGVVLFFVLWGVVMSRFAEPGRLASSFNPHMLVANEILGQPGRMLMGVARISGAAALVNGLFLVLRWQWAQMHPLIRRTETTETKKWQSILVLTLMAAGPALMMATGMAGEELVDVYSRTALVFWLLHYSLIHFAVWTKGAPWRWAHLAAGLILLGAVGCLACFEPQPVVFFKSVVMIALPVGAVSLIILQVEKKLIQGG